MIQNAYIHIPFCKQKCHYCSFISFPKNERKGDYIKSLIEEIKHYYKGEPLNTLYFGGGTPSLLTLSEFQSILELFKYDNTEITVEINPETVDKDYLNGLKKLGINRLSFGCQTFDEEILKSIGRKHTPKQVIECVKNAQEAGFKNISLDFIYGLPNQTLKIFETDLKTATKLDIQHISLYGLKIEEGCYFYSHMPKNLPDDDAQAEMYLKAVEILTANNFKHYEVSNFALEGYASRHNLNYWDNNSYYGFGVGAHGYDGKIRYSKTANLEDYIHNPLSRQDEKILSPQEQLEEEIFLGFRKMDGIDIKEINQKFSINFEEKYERILGKYSDYIEKTPQGYKLNTNGILISNVILSEFIQ